MEKDKKGKFFKAKVGTDREFSSIVPHLTEASWFTIRLTHLVLQLMLLCKALIPPNLNVQRP